MLQTRVADQPVDNLLFQWLFLRFSPISYVGRVCGKITEHFISYTITNSKSLIYCREMKQHKVNLISVMNGKALTMLSSSKDKKQLALCVKTPTKDPSQIFTLEKIKACYVVRHWTTGKVLDVYKEKDTLYSDIIGYDYHGKDNQMWILQEVSQGEYMMVNNKSKLALEIDGGIDAEGMGIIQNTKYKYKNQLWKLEVV